MRKSILWSKRRTNIRPSCRAISNIAANNAANGHPPRHLISNPVAAQCANRETAATASSPPPCLKAWTSPPAWSGGFFLEHRRTPACIGLAQRFFPATMIDIFESHFPARRLRDKAYSTLAVVRVHVLFSRCRPNSSSCNVESPETGKLLALNLNPPSKLATG